MKVLPDPYYGPAFHDQPILAHQKVRFVGEPMAVVIAADPHIVQDDDRVLRLEGAAGPLVWLRDAQHLVHAVEDADELRIDLVRTHDAQHGARCAGRPVHVHAQFDQPRDHRVDLYLGGTLFHHDDHDLLSHSCSGTVTVSTGDPLRPPRLVDHALEDPDYGFRGQRSGQLGR